MGGRKTSCPASFGFSFSESYYQSFRFYSISSRKLGFTKPFLCAKGGSRNRRSDCPMDTHVFSGKLFWRSVLFFNQWLSDFSFFRKKLFLTFLFLEAILADISRISGFALGHGWDLRSYFYKSYLERIFLKTPRIGPFSSKHFPFPPQWLFARRFS